jgi:hypothetical protein
MTGCIYIITEGSPRQIAEYRAGTAAPTFFKVGRALSSDVKELTPVEYRLARLQSCTTEPLAVIQVFSFATKEDAIKVEATFKKAHTPKFGVKLYKEHEWFHGTLPIADVAVWLIAHGARDATKEHADRTVQGRYEIDFGTIAPNLTEEPRYGTTVRLLEFTNQTKWQKLVACRYSDHVTLSAYWTGSPRQIKLVDKIESPTPNIVNEMWENEVATVLQANRQFWEAVEHKPSTAPRTGRAQTPWRYSGWLPSLQMDPIFSHIRNKLCAAR